jgi:hypothetical protein
MKDLRLFALKQALDTVLEKAQSKSLLNKQTSGRSFSKMLDILIY